MKSSLVKNYALYLSMLNSRYDDDGKIQWISTKDGHHIPLDSTGKAIAGCGGTLTGKDFSNAKSKNSWNSSTGSKSGAPYNTKRSKAMLEKKIPTKEEVERFHPDISNIVKPKDGFEYDETVAGACVGAYTDGDLDRWNQVVERLTEADIYYQVTKDGEKIASIIGIAAKVDRDVVGSDGKDYGQEVQDYYDSVAKDGEKTARELADIANELGTRLSGLENCVKGASHVANKIKRQKEKIAKRFGLIDENGEPDISSISDMDSIKAFSDIIRFTQVSKHADLIGDFDKTVKAFKLKGYKVAKIENKFLDPRTGKTTNSVDYKAIHLDLITPNGNKVEYQIQTEQTLKAKHITHKIYDEMNKTSDKDKKTALKQKMIDVVNMYVSNPEGIETIKNYP